jgi:hypothetical protein
LRIGSVPPRLPTIAGSIGPAQEPCTADDVPKLVADFAAVAGQDNAQLLAQLLEATLPKVSPAGRRQAARCCSLACTAPVLCLGVL